MDLALLKESMKPPGQKCHRDTHTHREAHVAHDTGVSSQGALVTFNDSEAWLRMSVQKQGEVPSQIPQIVAWISEQTTMVLKVVSPIHSLILLPGFLALNARATVIVLAKIEEIILKPVC